MRLVRRLLLPLLLLTLTAVGALYALSSRALARMATAEVPPFTHALPTDSAAIAEGERLARTRGCLGCHGERLEGEVFFEERGVARVVVPAGDAATVAPLVRSLAREWHVIGERLPAEAWDVLPPAASDRLSRRVRAAFDPHHILNPGLLAPTA